MLAVVGVFMSLSAFAFMALVKPPADPTLAGVAGGLLLTQIAAGFMLVGYWLGRP